MNTYIPPRLESESNIVYEYRIKYIDNNINKDMELRDVIRYSKMLANIKFKKCQYDPKIYNTLKLFL